MSLCEECSRIQLTCCARPGVEVCLTPGDIARISEYTGRSGFYHPRKVPEEMKQVYESPSNIKEGMEIYVRYLFDDQERRNILKKNERNGCCFLADTGCELPSDVRPIVCRLYPYDWNDRRDIWLDPRYCPESLFRDEEDLGELCVSGDEARRLIDLFYDEIMNGEQPFNKGGERNGFD